MKRTYKPTISDEVIQKLILGEPCRNIIEDEDVIVFNRFANLYIAFVVDEENVMYILALINHLMKIYDNFFNSACELHFIYNMKEAHEILDNFIVDGKCVELDVFEVTKHSYFIK